MRTRRAAFTLIELSVVMLLVALILVIASVSLKAPYQAARLEESLQRIAAVDHRLREHARRFHRSGELEINLETATLESIDGSGAKSVRHAVALPGGIRIDRVLLPTRRVDYGRIAIPCSAEGTTPTYALRVRGPADKREWLLFAGVTGELIQSAQEHEILELFSRVSTPGAHAP